VFRLYSEHVPLNALDAPLLRTLAARHIELAVAAFPGPTTDYAAMTRRAEAAGLRLVVWPMLDDALGRWPGSSNVHAFREHVLSLVELLPASILLFDMEPPLEWTRAAVRWRYLPRVRRRDSHAPLATSLRERGWQVEAVVPPMLAYGPRWERWLGTPTADLACARVEPMAYTSLFEGYSRGLVSRRVARDLLVRVTRRASGSVALGVVGGGALGDERAYRDVSELRDDVALARAAGAQRLSLYALDGILARGDVDAWLDAFTRTEPGVLPPGTRRGALLERAAAWLG